MNDINLFSARYKLLNDADLIAIVDSPDDYQPTAVDAATIELQSRQLTPAQVDEIRTRASTNSQLQPSQQQNLIRFKKSIFKKLNIDNQPLSKATRYINIITGAVGFFFIMAIMFGDTSIYKMMFSAASYNINFILIALPYVLLPLGTLLFGLRKKSGWIMLSAASTYIAAQLLYFEKKNLLIKADRDFGDMISYNELIVESLVLLLFAVVAIIMCRKDIRDIFKIDIKIMLFTMAVAVTVLVAQIFRLV
ncbi:hypothetical protein [Mucilaginibacter flavidus]|uniref:hypothetical protein n=1 Tax=Mucilaginibacter flavidus TaxID=2949309 RepID=UPI002093F742|nr:hypothetical protein [Mucilaginibacter flavidus]MCO5945597.1 hypothetical protein [Mucilaginibacter flavidus]